MGRQQFALLPGFAPQDRNAEHDVAVDRMRPTPFMVHEREHVGRAVAPAVAAVEHASFGFADEAQNTTPEQMKMFLTRIGFGTKAVITGDVTQIDLARGQKSGLIEARRVLADVRGIAFTDFTSADVVRNPLVQKIVNAYETHTRSARVDASDAGRQSGR